MFSFANAASTRIRIAALPLLAFSIAFCCLGGGLLHADDDAADLLHQLGRSGGLLVHVGCGEGQVTEQLAESSRFLIHGVARRPADVTAARQRLRDRRLYGRVSVDRYDGRRLPYAESMVTAIVVSEQEPVSDEELWRVVAPGGVVLRQRDGRWQKKVKPRPDDIDEWTHYLHDASGNAVASDEIVGPPRRLQWIGSPRWSRHHDRMASMSALVSANNRIFYIMDEGSRISIQLPSKWMLVGRDAFNGVELWKRPIPEWHNHLWPLKSGPTQLARRLVAVGDHVYAPLGVKAPISILKAATGETVAEIEGTEGAEELIVHDGTVYAMVNQNAYETDDFEPLNNVGDQGRVAKEWRWNERPREIVAADALTGEVKWRRKASIAPLTLAAGHDRVFYFDGGKVVALNAGNGEPAWQSAEAKRRAVVTMNFGPKLVVYDGMVLFAGGDRLMHAYDASGGDEIWTAPHARGGYQSPEDLLVAGGLIWSAPTTSGRDSGVFTGRDPKTGEVKKEFPPDVETYWFHHRCYIAKATDRFLLPSRTGVEFVDMGEEHWDIHHWVRGGCLYGVMPCNGLLYAPPHNCACYPEAKLSGMNALAPASNQWTPPTEVSEAERLEQGPAFGKPVTAAARPGDWPTYRGDRGRKGHSSTRVGADAQELWKVQLQGRLTSPTVAEGKLFVAEIDQHTLHALNERTGKSAWTFTAGGRIDSPPTIEQGRVYFGCVDGWVYCLRASDGALIWRYRAAPEDRRLVAFGQLESVWPVHGSVLVEGDSVYCVAGRSVFLDGGMRLLAIDAKTGEQVGESVLDDKDADTGQPLQDRIATLQMPVGLPDILSSDGRYIYMKSQRFDHQGRRQSLGPISGDPALHGGSQKGDFSHLFAPMGFLDNDWFHRSYWVFGQNYAGGHNGYYQAGKYAPSGRILTADDERVYGFARKPQYYKWTTTIEHHLFASSKSPPDVEPQATRRGRSTAGMINFEKPKTLSPVETALTVEAWVRPERPEGVVLAHGGPLNGYALVVRQGKPRFVSTIAQKRYMAPGKKRIAGKWTHLVGVLSDGAIRLYVDGEFVSQAKTSGLIKLEPAQGLQIGADEGSPVGDYRSPLAFSGMIDEVRVYHTALSDEQISKRFADAKSQLAGAKLVLSCSFDKATAADESSFAHPSTARGATPALGKHGRAMRFRARGGAPQTGSFVKHDWNLDLPLYAQAMVSTRDVLFAAGPPDLIDEEETFKRLTIGDRTVQKLLSQQDAALAGEQGGVLVAVDKASGKKLNQWRLSAPPSWDAMAAAHGRLFLTLQDGTVRALGKPPEAKP